MSCCRRMPGPSVPLAFPYAMTPPIPQRHDDRHRYGNP